MGGHWRSPKGGKFRPRVYNEGHRAGQLGNAGIKGWSERTNPCERQRGAVAGPLALSPILEESPF